MMVNPQHRFKSVEDMFRSILMLLIVLWVVLKEDSQLSSSEVLLLDSANGKPTTLSDDFVSLYTKDIDMEKLKLQLKLLPDAVKTVTPDGIPIRQVTRVQTLCDVLNTRFKTLMSEVHKLLKIYLTIPVTTASSERNFSALKRIKTYLRNSMTQSRLNHRMLLHVHKDRTDSIDTKDIASEFIQNCSTRTAYFGSC